MGKRTPITLLLILPFLLFLSSGCGRNREPLSQTGFYFDTVITITLYPENGVSEAESRQLLSDCFSLCGHYETLLSPTLEGSDIWRINHARGKPVKVSGETADLLQTALFYCGETNGAVDITIAPVSSLWDFSAKGPASARQVPKPEKIRELLPHVNYKTVRIDKTDNTVTLSDPLAAVDPGCIAKGYIADRLKELLLSRGADSALIDLGGNTLAVGEKPGHTPFRLGIRKPFSARYEAVAVVPVTDASLVSSGTYERCFEKDGIFYHHLLNAKTGMPENNGLLSVTILSASSAEGDILSTACFLLGPEKGMDYIESVPGAEAVFLTEDYVLHPSSGISSLLYTP